MAEKEVTEEKVTEDETIPEFAKDGLDARIYKLHALMNECMSLARETVEGEFAALSPQNVDNLAESVCIVGAALFHKVAVPDQTETMLAALERGLEWYGRWQEAQKAESAKIDAEFKKSIGMVLPKPARKATQIERLMRFAEASQSSMLRFVAEELAMEQEEAIAEKPIDTFTQEKGSPTPEE